MAPSLPSDLQYGTVIGQWVLAIADTTDDEDRLPDAVYPEGTVTFTPVFKRAPNTASPTVFVAAQPVTGNLRDGALWDATGPGVTLLAGVYDVTFAIANVPMAGYQLAVPAGGTIDLNDAAPPIPDPTVRYVASEESYRATLVAQAAAEAAAERAEQAAASGAPAGGWAKNSLSAPVQATLSLADSALQADDIADLLPGGRLGARSRSIDGTDLNNITENGFYSGDNLVNSPDGSNGFFYVEHFQNRDTDEYAWQRAAAGGLGTGNAGYGWQRFREGNGGWSSWDLISDPTGAVDGTLRTQLAPVERLGARSKNIEGQDLNGILDNGWYVGTSLVNAPDGSYYYVQVETFEAANWVQQRAINIVNGASAVRQKRGGTWTGWTQVADASGAVDVSARTSISDTLGSGGRLGYQVTYRDGLDANALTTSGWVSGAGIANAPDPNSLIIETIAQDSIWAVQRATAFTGSLAGTTWLRLFQNGVWSAWVKTGDPQGAVDATARILGNGAVPLSSAVAGQVFAKNASGTPSGIAYSSSPLANYLALRDGNGNVNVAQVPTADVNAASKKYVDDRAGDKAPAVSAAGVTGTYDLSQVVNGSCTYRLALTGNTTLTIPTPSSATLTWTVTLVIRQDATGSRTVTWPSSIKWSNGAKPTLSTTPNATDVVTIEWTGVEWLGFLGGVAFA